MQKAPEPRRILTNFLLAVLISAPLLFIGLAFPAERHIVLFTIVLGYLSLILLFLSLLIGPLNLLRLRRNPVNLFLRRDISIWAAITGCYHVALVFQMRFGPQLLQYFLKDGSYLPLVNLYGLSNDTGLFATILLVILLALSNTFSLRLLKGKRWKQIQRLSYLLVPLAVIHTFGYQYLGGRDLLLVIAVIIMVAIVLLGQGMGIALTRSRKNRRARVVPPGAQS
jgi:DMSO/TMAO reductase YedYZ heme-binding membrane subunit